MSTKLDLATVANGTLTIQPLYATADPDDHYQYAPTEWLSAGIYRNDDDRLLAEFQVNA